MKHRALRDFMGRDPWGCRILKLAKALDIILPVSDPVLARPRLLPALPLAPVFSKASGYHHQSSNSVPVSASPLPRGKARLDHGLHCAYWYRSSPGTGTPVGPTTLLLAGLFLLLGWEESVGRETWLPLQQPGAPGIENLKGGVTSAPLGSNFH